MDIQTIPADGDHVLALFRKTAAGVRKQDESRNIEVSRSRVCLAARLAMSYFHEYV